MRLVPIFFLLRAVIVPMMEIIGERGGGLFYGSSESILMDEGIPEYCAEANGGMAKRRGDSEEVNGKITYSLE